VTLRLDKDVIEWFKRQGSCQNRINPVLRTYVEGQKTGS